MPLTIDDFNVPNEHPYGMLSGQVQSHTSEKESMLAFILGKCIEAGDLYAAIETKFIHPTMVEEELLEEVSFCKYKLTLKAVGLLYSHFGKV